MARRFLSGQINFTKPSLSKFTAYLKVRYSKSARNHLFVFKLGAAEENFGKKDKSKMDNYIQIKTIGRGTYGVADLVLHKEEQRHYVAKKILIGTLKP